MSGKYGGHSMRIIAPPEGAWAAYIKRQQHRAVGGPQRLALLQNQDQGAALKAALKPRGGVQLRKRPR